MVKPSLQFPCAFPIKVMGVNAPDFTDNIYEIVIRHAPDTPLEALAARTSREDRYIALTIQIQARDRAQLDELYRELNAHPQVRMTL
jgi:putative lipoic acid-binding regulatory protein